MARQLPQGPFVHGVQLSRSDGFCTTQEAAALFGIHKSTFQQWRRKHSNFPRARHYSKRMVLFSVDELLDWFHFPQESVREATKFMTEMARIGQDVAGNKTDGNYTDETELIRDCRVALGIDEKLSLTHQSQFVALIEQGLPKVLVSDVLVRLQKKKDLRDSGKTSYLLTCLERELNKYSEPRLQKQTEANDEENAFSRPLEEMLNELRS